MTTATTADLVAASTAAGTAVLAFNVITLEHAEAIARGAEAASSGVILQVSENTVRFHGGNAAPVLAACAEVAAAASVPIALHLDHFTEPALIDAAIDMAQRFAVSSIMIDAAHLDFRDNVEQTARYADAARQRDCGWRPNWARSAAKTAPMRPAYAPTRRRPPTSRAVPPPTPWRSPWEAVTR
jgi:fructose-bisphosphate aldolase class II